MTEQEAIEIFEKARSLHEQMDLARDIDIIDSILSQNPIDICQIRMEIGIINEKHRENTIIFNIIFPPKGRRPFVDEVPAPVQISDLQWKRTYLQAKRIGKTFDELRKEMQKDIDSE